MNGTDKENLEHWLAIERKNIRNKRCADCGKKIKPTFKPTSDPLDWCFLDCDVCLEDFCPKCCDTDENGKCTCFTCYEIPKYTHKGK